ncbi:TIGR02302 family protein [Microvirga arsenatis]|uniref:TIGR02302 family protein n=1 Tax=Microvirga arsenatis TaxID=2692265 RepID=A0ABW9YY18_9HYPH|nr:TIGR02302 family protein [Microvirga arsenatis]NBJ11692.1 TIGR02302 family protein [Microvirga arsenatis]NBJ24973.1 TIGR02302 family protein [Microvirga arsenatis]
MSEGPNPTPGRDTLNQRFGRLVAHARWSLWWEEAWPRLWLPLAIVLLFLTLSWLGLWLDMPLLWRTVGLGLFTAAFLLSLWPILRLRLPSRTRALDRLDRETGLATGPARVLDDTLALGSSDPGTRALWALHRRRAEEAVGRMRVGLPRPDMPRRDRYALRAAGVLALVTSAFVAGPEIGSRLTAAFDWRQTEAAAPTFRIDGWVDPPLYTRMPPLMIDLARGQSLRAPMRSTVVVRIAGEGSAEIKPGKGLTPLPPKTGQRTDMREERYTLEGSSQLTISTGFAHSTTLTIEAIPDRMPEIAFTTPPEVNARGTFTLSYKGKDDYGIVALDGIVEKADNSKGRSLVPAPQLTLALPGHEENAPDTKSPVDLTNHAWAGAPVTIRLKARDEAGQEATSEALSFTLPQRPFTNPLAKALVEQRRNLVLAPDDRKRVQVALDALLIAPEDYTPQWGVFMGLRAGAERLRVARTDQDLLEVAEWLWTMALQIEDGGLSDAERELRAAQERLREAMDRGAPNEEIRRLTEELRQAMDKFLREFAQRMQQNQQQSQNQNQRMPDRMVTQDDLNRMLQQMEEAMRRGDVAEAQRLLEQLRNILENLQTAQPNNRMTDPLGREMNQAMQDLEDMAREQQNLRDETFRNGQNQRMQQGDRNGQRQQGQRQGQRQQGQRQPGQQGQQGEGQEQAESGQGGRDQDPLGLRQRQQALRERLEELQRRMQGMGMQGEQGLSDAEQAMRDAEGALGHGQDGPAVDAQGRALENLRRGMQGMAQQMQQMQQGDGQGNEQAGDQPGQGNPQGNQQTGQQNNDPLGRPMRTRDFSDGRVDVPSAGQSPAQRAQRILEELRRKLGDPTRPQEELDYFERLLRRN